MQRDCLIRAIGEHKPQSRTPGSPDYPVVPYQCPNPRRRRLLPLPPNAKEESQRKCRWRDKACFFRVWETEGFCLRPSPSCLATSWGQGLNHWSIPAKDAMRGVREEPQLMPLLVFPAARETDQISSLHLSAYETMLRMNKELLWTDSTIWDLGRGQSHCPSLEQENKLIRTLSIGRNSTHSTEPFSRSTKISCYKAKDLRESLTIVILTRWTWGSAPELNTVSFGLS